MSNAITKAAGSQPVSVTKTVQRQFRKDITNPLRKAVAGKGPVSIGKAAQKGAVAASAFYGGEKLLHKGMETYGAEVNQGIDKVKGTLGFNTEPEKLDLSGAKFDFENSL